MAHVTGQVLSGGAPAERATVTLWAATAGAPVQLGRAATGADGRFRVSSAAAPAKDASLYLVAEGGRSSADKTGGDNDRMALMTVLGGEPPSSVVINELTTVASVWTHAQFVDGAAIKGHALGLRIAAGNVPNPGCSSSSTAQQATAADAQTAYDVGMEGYNFLYPVARIDLTRPQVTSVVAAGQVIGCVPVFPPADFLDVVRPNFDSSTRSPGLISDALELLRQTSPTANDAAPRPGAPAPRRRCPPGPCARGRILPHADLRPGQRRCGQRSADAGEESTRNTGARTGSSAQLGSGEPAIGRRCVFGRDLLKVRALMTISCPYRE